MTALLKNITSKFDYLNQAASSSLQNAIDKADAWDDRLINALGNSIASHFDLWLTNHPFVAWSIDHFAVSLAGGSIALVLIIRLFITIYRAIALAIDRMWLWILRSPMSLLKFVFGWQGKPKANTLNTTITNYEVTNNPEQIQQILTRLNSIQQQQQQIIQDLADLKMQSPHIEAKSLDLTLLNPKKTNNHR